jgi:hypothetical protein
MNGNTDIFRVERVVFFNGQRLTAGDLTAAQDVSREMRWLHNRSLHNWGIGFGLAITGEKNAREVTIAPGYALDAMGREIVLVEAQTVAVPPLAGENGQPASRDLTIAYPTDDEVEVVETRAGICLPRGAVRLSEMPVIRWLETAQVRNGFDIVLARASIRNCQLDAPLSTAQRRNARPTQQPYIACGKTPVGSTEWSPWKIQNTNVGFETKVDTSAARFRITPRYLARVEGERLSPPRVNLQLPFLIEGFASVDNAKPDGFVLRVLMPRLNFDQRPILNPTTFLNNLDASRILGQQQLWHVVWIGIEG